MRNAPIWLKAAFGIVIALAIVGVWLQLTSGILLMQFHRPYEDARPWTVIQYWQYYGQVKSVQQQLAIAAGAAFAICVVPFALFLRPNRRSLHGDARFARRREIRRAGLLGDHGIVVGRLGNQYLMFGGPGHAIISAPTRSGKGVGVVIPNLLSWPGSVVVLDIKQENWALTSKYRAAHGQACFLFSPAAADMRSHRWNPLGYLSADPARRIDEIQKVANMLFPDRQGTDIIWTATPRSLFLGIVLSLVETPGMAVTLGQVLRETLSGGDGTEHFHQRIAQRQAVGDPFSPACIQALNSYLTIASENTRAGVMTGFRSSLELWMNPFVDAATSANDFDLQDLRRKHMSVYIGVSPDNLVRMAPLLNLFFQQLIDLNLRALPEHDPTVKHTCLLLMDEFTAMGRVPVLAKGSSFIAGYKLRLLPIIQSPAQLIEVYGREGAETFMVNHALTIVYPPKASETSTARDISEWLGYQTVKGQGESKSRGGSRQSKTVSTSDQRRALMLPQEISGMKPGKQLVVMEGMPPILADKVRYFDDVVFMGRLKSVSPMLSASRNPLPSHDEVQQATRAGELSAPVPALELVDPSNVGREHAFSIPRELELNKELPDLGGLRTLERYVADLSSQAGLEPA